MFVDEEGSGESTGSTLLSSGEGCVPTYYGDSDESGGDSTPPMGGTSGGGGPIAHYHDTLSMRSVYSQIWRVVQILSADPCPVVSQRAENIIHIVLDKVILLIWSGRGREGRERGGRERERVREGRGREGRRDERGGEERERRGEQTERIGRDWPIKTQ